MDQQEERVSMYKRVFMNEQGDEVLSDLERLINHIRLDPNNPNPNTAIYIQAQRDLINKIKKLIAS